MLHPGHIGWHPEVPGSGLIKDIGPVMAKRIVAQFGDNILEVIENEPDRLTEVEGIAEKRIEMIRKAWEEQKEIRIESTWESYRLQVDGKEQFVVYLAPVGKY